MADIRHQARKRVITHEVFGKDDRISLLPNSIIICILSKLKLDEAARTSVLSKYWRDLWKCTTNLEFEGAVLLRNRDFLSLTSGRQRLKYVSWVNKVLKSVKPNKELGLDAFKICFEEFSSGKAIQSWLSYAFERRVQRLELDFSIPFRPKMGKRPRDCSFPRLLDQNTKELSEDPDCRNRSFTCTLAIADFNSLRSLSLSSVHVIREVLEYILRKFPLLEHLKVCDCVSLSGIFKVCGQSLALKHLEITRCLSVESLVVRDTGIVSLRISAETDLMLEDNPKLVEGCICVPMFSSDFRPNIFSCLLELEALTLCFADYWVGTNPIEIPQLPKVKQLTLVVEKVGADEDFMNIISLLKSFPNVEKLVLKVNSVCSFFMTYNGDFVTPTTYPLLHLQSFEMNGYSGLLSQDVIIGLVVVNAPSLRRITINTELNVVEFPHLLFGKCCDWKPPKGYCVSRYWKYPHDPFDRCEGKAAAVKRVRDGARNRAQCLMGVLPSAIEVVLL